MYRKNYRKPLLQRYVIRILLMYAVQLLRMENCLYAVRVPIYSASSWASIMSLTAAFYLDPIRDIYEVSDTTRFYAAERSYLIKALGIHHLHIFSTSHKLHWR